MNSDAIYDRLINQRIEISDRVEPKPVVIVEGIFALHHPELLELYNIKVFVETSTDDVRYHRRMIRDIKERGDTEATVAKAWATNVMPMHQRYVSPQRDQADIVVLGEADVRQSLKQVLIACALLEAVRLRRGWRGILTVALTRRRLPLYHNQSTLDGRCAWALLCCSIQSAQRVSF